LKKSEILLQESLHVCITKEDIRSI